METVEWGTLPEELRAMPFTLRIMEFVGLWGSWANFYRFALLYSLGIMDIVFPKIFLGIGSDDVTAICKGVAELMFELSIYCTLAILAAKRKTFEQVIRGLDEIFREATFGEESNACYDMIFKLNQTMRKVFRFLVVYCIYAPFAFALPSFLISHWRFWSGSEPLICELPMEQKFYGLQIRTNFAHYHIFVGISVAAYCVCAFLELIKVTSTCFMIKYSSLTYRLVAEKVRKLPQKDGSKTKVTVEDLKRVVELHRKAYKITDLIEEMCQVPVALEFLFCIMVWCLNMIYISQKIDLNLINVMIIFFLSLVHVFCYSYLGSELIEEAAAVGTAIYDLPWYEHSAELQRYYRLMLQRTQRPTGITGVKFFVVERTTFFSVVQMAYSYYLVLKDVLNKL